MNNEAQSQMMMPAEGAVLKKVAPRPRPQTKTEDPVFEMPQLSATARKRPGQVDPPKYSH
jgi:hypothetical protein